MTRSRPASLRQDDGLLSRMMVRRSPGFCPRHLPNQDWWMDSRRDRPWNSSSVRSTLMYRSVRVPSR